MKAEISNKLGIENEDLEQVTLPIFALNLENFDYQPHSDEDQYTVFVEKSADSVANPAEFSSDLYQLAISCWADMPYLPHSIAKELPKIWLYMILSGQMDFLAPS